MGYLSFAGNLDDLIDIDDERFLQLHLYRTNHVSSSENRLFRLVEDGGAWVMKWRHLTHRCSSLETKKSLIGDKSRKTTLLTTC
jgi:hypothetical protein